jgi:PilZ domain
MTLAVERRAEVRHEPVDNRTSMQIMEWTGLRVKRARLVNFSTSGALIRIDQVPTLHQPLRVRLENAKEIGWFSAIPVRLGRSNEVGIQFTRPFPLDFLSNSLSEGGPPLVADTDDETRFLGEASTEWGLPEENR